MTPQRPYLLKAIYEWVLDNDEIPYILVDAKAEGVQVPSSSINEGRVVLNISPAAVENLVLGLEEVSFSCRFDGHVFLVRFPIRSVLALYSRADGKGISFDSAEYESASEDVFEGQKKPNLKLV